MNKLPILTEAQEQEVLVQYLEIQKNLGNVFLFTSIPNSTFTKSWNQKRKNTEQGLRKGFPDLVVITAAGILLAIELKRIKGGVIGIDQKKWNKYLNLCGKSVIAKICYGSQEAIEFISEYFPAKKR